jgi:hypothetical protein
MPRTPDFAQDARILNRLSGHSHSATRADLSGQAERARAAEARRSTDGSDNTESTELLKQFSVDSV